ncbi:Alpha-2-macroglobulin family protein [Chitinophaga jiangningensis]|uniref:Alpha-2-macroglobulin family protein n=1 Tax=Chitinophaga jiangningensis TaxID=1419482 RepID=A0A1M7M178_9BACT|nr:alpha-2-macroglobulin family protein [Chitinophaga jiangningensis]SHM84418.1 Alpha-2-macroglobulin family protein [Chitinophaga jiangningensis]
MKRILTTVLVLLTATVTYAQQLSNAHTTGQTIALFKITDAEAARLYKASLEDAKIGSGFWSNRITDTRPLAPTDALLHTYVRSWPANAPTPADIPPGQYLLVQGEENAVRYQYYPVKNVRLHTLQNLDGRYISLTDKNRLPLHTPEVLFRGRRLAFHSTYEAYQLPKASRNGIVRVKHEGVTNFFYIGEQNYFGSPSGWIAKKWSQLRKIFSKPYTNKEFKGYLVTSKPKYKPGDTVRLKAFITNAKGIPVNIPLQLKLGQERNDEEEDTILQVLRPYRPGAYEHTFVLTEDLDLDLDETYKISLGTRFKTSRKKEYIHKTFEYEAYELSQLTFKARSDKNSYSPGMPVKFFLKATDENNLPLLDGRVTVTVNINASSNFQNGITFIPKKLWQQEITLEQTGETVVLMPDSIFPQADLQCSVTCQLNSSSNDTQTESFTFSRLKTLRDVRFERIADSIAITYSESGRLGPATGRIIFYNGAKDSIGQVLVTFPATIPASPYIARYTAVTGDYRKDYNVSANMSEISFTGYRQNDSIFATLENPYKIPVWYQIFADKRLITSGKGTNVNWAYKSTGNATYSLYTSFIYGDASSGSGQYVRYLPASLDVKIHAPETIQPGQTARITVAVKNNQQQPVADADVTAYAHTSKFNTYDPEVPYLDRIRTQSPRLLPGYGVAANEDYNEKGPLNWSRWKTILGLDTMPFFRFFHPEGLLYNFEPAVHGITQVAPFVIKNNHPQISQLVWINDNLVYVNGTEPQYNYSFRVTPGRQSIRIVTAEHEIVLDSVYAPAGMKTFISIPVDKSLAGIRITPRKKPLFTDAEKTLLNNMLLVLKAHDTWTKQYINNDNLIFPITKSYYQDVIVGPVSKGSAYYFASPLMTQQFDPEPGYRYTISKGLVKQEKLDIAQSYFSRRLPAYSNYSFRLHDYVLTATDMDSLYNSNLENMSLNLRTYASNKNTIRLLFPDSIRTNIRQIFVYNYDAPNWLEMVEGDAGGTIIQPAGYYKLLVMMKNNGFITLDSVLSKADHETIYKWGQVNIQPDNDTIHSLRQRLNLAFITGNYTAEFEHKPEKLSPSYPDPKPVTSKGANLNRLVKGTVRDNHGTPIPNATVIIHGTGMGTYTNERGAYALYVSDSGTLAFRSVGYRMAVRTIQTDDIYDVILFPQGDDLSEVVVVGYGTTHRKALTGSVSRLLQGQVAGVTVGAAKRKFFSGLGQQLRVRGIGSMDSEKAPMLVVDGVPFNGSLSDINEELVKNMEVLAGEGAVALYGSRAADGVVIINTTVKGGLKSPAPPEAETPKISLRHHFRDEAYWQPRLRTNEHGEAAFEVTFPDDITSWKSYALIAGDKKQSGFATAVTRAYNQVSANLALPQFTLAGDTLDVLTKIMNYNGDSIQLNRMLNVAGTVLKNGPAPLRHSLIETSTVAVPAGDSLRNTFTISNNNVSDGEYRAVPIYQPGTMEAFGKFLQLPGDTSFILPATKDTGTVHLYAATSAMPVLLQEASYLYSYRYDCNEQLASKLIAALLQKRWAAALDTNIHINEHISNMISKLEKARNMDGLWGWWADGVTSGWISAHVLKALNMAAEAGFRTRSANKDLTRLLMPHIYDYAIDTRLDFLGYLRDTDSTFNLRAYVDTINTNYLTPIQQLRLLEIKQRAGITVSTANLLRTVKKTLFGNAWWGPDSLDIYNSRIQYTLLAYRILRNEGGHDALLHSTRAWLLDQRGPYCWRNTYESATIMGTIGDDILREQEQKAPALQVNNTNITKFPYEAQLPAGQALQISKTGNRMLYLNTWQRRFNANPERVDSAFKVRTHFKAEDKEVTSLTAGKKVTLEAVVEVKEDAGFIMIEVPIPAGCSYNGKPQPYSNSEVHREYYYEKVSIFCQYLHKGSYIFSIPLMPRYTGSFQLNPAKAEMMYFPVFYGREGMKRIPIK